ncbi:hypothetical protein DRW03_10265 [Corallococcus sp. H22C18031201]|uniref:hypothetical protein n=1 Tax=Citreicoccus inhibens TaxID=2849499 RepID=UPI000E767A59|nr:hypothetical protein [Citreicoccus inhibens]MBU8899329.1 hypothetical protein [Citreicoccus inhibens]RJS23990.1 hypothetical protein DRW03_10265 [Corallococcus sp. H22C18031201]
MAIEIPDSPLDTPFSVPPWPRTEVTDEPPRLPGFDPRYPDVSWDGEAQHGGGHVPDDFAWTGNPKEHQDELMGEWPAH